MYKATKLPKSEVKLEFEVAWDEAKPYLDEAARELTTAKPIPGFRPGKATYEDAKRAYGEMKILETAIERIVRANYVKAVLEEKLDTIGSPEISVEQLVPGQAIKFTTTASLLPTIVKLPDLKACKIERKAKPVTDERVSEAVDEMRKMRRTEVRVERPATMDDLIVVDMEMSQNKVALEGGTGRDYRVYLSEPNYIPGLAQQLAGMKSGDEKSFTLPFPQEHFQKHLAGKDVDFKVKATGVFELAMPPADDAFAKGVGIDSIVELRNKLKENMEMEEAQRAREAAEIELLEKLTDLATYSEIPELLVNEEVRRMFHELEHGVEEQGMNWNDYLASIKKTPDQLKLDFIPNAIRRIKTAILIKSLSTEHDLKPSEEEINAEIDRILEQIPQNDRETRERVTSSDYREYVGLQLRNRMTVDWLMKQCAA